MSAGSIALPRVRRKRKRPWSPRTKECFLNCVIDVCLLVVSLLWYPTDKAPFSRFIDFVCAIAWGLLLHWNVRQFRMSRERDENGE